MDSLSNTLKLAKSSLLKNGPALNLLSSRMAAVSTSNQVKLSLSPLAVNPHATTQSRLFSSTNLLASANCTSKCKKANTCNSKNNKNKRFVKKSNKAPFDPTSIDYKEFEGYVHSVESMGSLEGPGNRFLLFVTGCPARCIYCENPDTWNHSNGNKMKIKTLIKKANNLKPYYTNSIGGGGVTVSGGDPLAQPEFVSSFLYAMKHDVGLHTCIETSGQGSQYAWDTVLPHVDLALLCIKHPNPAKYKEITKTCELDNMLKFIKELEKRNIPWWCRYVVISGITDNDSDLKELVDICNNSKTLQRVDLLPYHTLGEHKWKELGLTYIMGENLIPSKDKLRYIGKYLKDNIKDKNVEVTNGAE